MTALASRTQVNLPQPMLVEDVFDQGGGVFPRIMALASAARAANPNLGGYLRAYRRTPRFDTGHTVPYRLVFTEDGSSELPEGVISDPKAKDFFEALQETFGEDFEHQAQQNLYRRIPIVNGVVKANGQPVEAALHEAFLQDRLTAPMEYDLEGDARYAVTEAIAIEPHAFMQEPDLAQMVLFHRPGPADDREDPVVRLRDRFHGVLDVLGKPFEKTSALQRQQVVDNIRALNRMSPNDSFEESMNHGWVGYAIGESLKKRQPNGWTSFLIHQAHASPYAFYGNHSPLTLAGAANDAVAVTELLQAGVSPSTVIRGMPNLFMGNHQAYLNSLGNTSVPALTYMAMVGSTAALGAMLQGGADPNHTTDRQDTALHRAAAFGDDMAVRLLLRHGASAVATDGDGRRPEELVPAGGLHDSLYKLLVDAANKELGVVDAQLQNEVEPRPSPDLAPVARQIVSPRRPAH